MVIDLEFCEMCQTYNWYETCDTELLEWWHYDIVLYEQTDKQQIKNDNGVDDDFIMIMMMMMVNFLHALSHHVYIYVHIGTKKNVSFDYFIIVIWMKFDVFIQFPLCLLLLLFVHIYLCK